MTTEYTKNDERWMQKAMKLATEAQLTGEVPVGAIVVLNDEIIGQGFNRSIIDHDPSAHAEILALRDAAKNIGNYRIIDATLYVTLEPFPMCAGAIVHSRVKRVVYGSSDFKTGAAGSVMNLLQHAQLNHQVEVVPECCAAACGKQISDFFKARREVHKQAKQARKLAQDPGAH